MITLYAKDATDFTTNGLGVLDGGIATVPEVEEAFNGAYTLTLRYVSWGRYRDLIDYDCIIKAPTPDGDQRFRIYKITKQIGFVEIVANHVFYDLAGNFIEDANLVDQNGGDALNHIGTSLQSPTNFTFKSNIETTASARLVRLNAVQALLDTSQDNSFVNRWGGELLRDNDQVIFNAVRGSNRGFSVKYGKNLTSYEATIDTTSVVTRIMPYGYDGLMIPEKYVDSDLIDKYPFVHVKKIEYSEIKAIDPESNSNDDTAVPLEDAYALLRAAAQNEYTTNHVDQPQANFKVSFQDLQKTREYADFEALETLLPWDYVNVDADGLPIDARMISYRYDPLNRRYIEVELGNYVSEYTDTVAGKVDSLTSSLMKVSEQASHAAVSANGKNTNYYGTATPPNPVDGDLWYKQNGDSTELWQYDGKSVPPGWKLRVSDLTGQEISDKVDNALKEVDAAKQAADKAVEQANIAVTQSGLSQESAKAAAEAVQAAQAIAQEVSASLAAAQAQAANAAGDAAEALKEAQDALAAANGQSAQVKSLQQIVDDTTGTISTLAKQVDVDTVAQQVKTTQTLSQQTANGLLLKSDQSVVDTLSGTVKQQSVELKAAQDQLALKLTQNDLTNSLSGYATQTWAQNQITATANAWKMQLSTVQTQIGNIGQKNLVYNSELISSTDSWATNSNISIGSNQYDHYNGSNSLAINETTLALGGWNHVYSKPVAVVSGDVYSASATLFITGPSAPIATDVYLTIDFFDTNGKRIAHTDAKFDITNPYAKQYLKVENQVAPTSAVTMCLAIWFNGQINLMVNHPMLVAASSVGPYQPSSASDTELAGTITRIGVLETTSSQYLQRLTKTESNATTALTNIQNVQADVNSYTQQLATVQQSVNRIGQTNLVDNSEFEGLTSASEWYISRAIWPDGIVPHLVYNRVDKSGWTGWQSNWVTIDDMSQQYSASMSVIGASATSCLTIEFGDDKGNRTSAYDNYFDIKGNEVQLLKVQGVKPDANAKMVRLNWNVNNNGHIAMREPMLVAAPIVGPYVASRVTISAFNTIKSTVNGTVQTIADINNNKLVTINNSINGLQTTVAGKASQTQLTQLDSQLTSVVGGLGQKNYIYNSELANSGDGWTMPAHWMAPTSGGYDQYKGSYGIRYAAGGGIVDNTVYSVAYAKPVPVAAGQLWSGSVVAFVTGSPLASVAVTGSAYLELWYLDKNKATMTFGATTVRGSTPKLLPADGYNKATLKVENFAVPTDAAYIMFRLVVNGSGNVVFCQPMLTPFASVGSYQPDTVGNSQITQLQDAINLRVTKDGIISQINMTAGKTLIQNNSIYLDASTVTMGGTAFINAANIKSVNASTITAGKLDASLIDVVGLNAKSITTGTITGENLSINLATGEVTFAKGAIKSTNGRLNIDVNDGTFAQSDGTKGMLFADGNLYLSSASWWDQVSGVPYTKPDYGFIGYTDTLLTARGFGVIGRDALTLGLTDNGNPGMEYTASPVITMSRSNVTLNFSGELATLQAGKGFTIKTNSIYNVEQIPGIQIGSNVGRTGIGDRVFIDGSYVYVPSAYDRTTSGSANLIVAADGALVRTSSATKYKSDIQRFSSTDAAERFLEVPQAHWLNKQDLQRYSVDPQHYKFPKYDFGMIAEDLAAQGLEDFVVRGDDGQLEDIRYDRIAPALLPLIKEMKLEIDTLKEELKS